MNRFRRIIIYALILAACLSGCMRDSDSGIRIAPANTGDTAGLSKPIIPEKLELNENGLPMLSVYDLTIKEASDMDIETYIMGVVAGEMKNDWPIEALKAQAILARTFVLKFCQDKESRYENADISTDIKEAQAYSYENINERVREAVQSTRGMVMSVEGELPNAWFHAHSGGMTEIPSVALDYKNGDPEYLRPVKSDESKDAPDSVESWTARFTKKEVTNAAKESGLNIDVLNTVEIGEKGASGRTATLLINGQTVSAPTFRVHIGSSKLKSMLLDSVKVENDEVVFKGRGYGHGVGMSQWGAYSMAKKGKNAKEIIEHYFHGVDIVELW